MGRRTKKVPVKASGVSTEVLAESVSSTTADPCASGVTYQAECIRAKKKVKGKTFYEIKWQGTARNLFLALFGGWNGRIVRVWWFEVNSSNVFLLLQDIPNRITRGNQWKIYCQIWRCGSIFGMPTRMRYEMKRGKTEKVLVDRRKVVQLKAALIGIVTWIAWLIDWSSNRLTDWSTDWLIDWLIDYSIDWLIDWWALSSVPSPG